MTMIGIDPHKPSHTAVAIDDDEWSSPSSHCQPRACRSSGSASGPRTSTSGSGPSSQRHDEAWDAATDAGCTTRRWMELAERRESSHPIDAIGIYEPQIARSIEAKNNQGYAAAVDLMARVDRLATAAGVPDRFDKLVEMARPSTSRSATSRSSSTKTAGDSSKSPEPLDSPPCEISPAAVGGVSSSACPTTVGSRSGVARRLHATSKRHPMHRVSRPV